MALHHRPDAALSPPRDLNGRPTKPELALAVSVHPYRPYLHASVLPAPSSCARSHHDSVISHPHSPLASDPPSPPSIASGSFKQADRDAASPSDPAKAMIIERERVPLPAPAASGDPEKRIVSPTSHTSGSRSRSFHADPEIGIEALDESPEDAELQEKALRILIYLSAFCPLISIGILFWALVSVFLAVLLLPLRAILSTKLPGLRSLLLPALRLQLRLIYSAHASDEAFDSPHGGSLMLPLIHLFSPALAPIAAIASWTAAFFWFFSAVLGDPAGKDGHNDGRAAVLFVRYWWEEWLLRGLN